MSNAYDPKLRALAHQVADELGMKSFVREGVYFYVAGPCYETIAEIRMARCLGGDVVGTRRFTITSYCHSVLLFVFLLLSVC